MKTRALHLSAILVLLCSSGFGWAQNTDDGSSVSWKEIDYNLIVESDSDSTFDLSQSQLTASGSFSASGGGGLSYGTYSADVKAAATSGTELKAFARVEATADGPGGLSTLPSRINGDATAYIGEKWSTQSSILAPGQTFSSVVDLQWDGSLKIGVPGHPVSLDFPNFNEVGFQVNFALYEVAGPEDEPLQVWSYFSNSLVLRADGSAPGGGSFTDAVTTFDRDVFGPASSTFALTLNATEITLPAGEVGYDIVLGGQLPFEATVGKEYIVNYGLTVYANVTGAVGYAEADFFNTGSVGLEAVNPSEGSFVIPEPSTFLLLIVGLASAHLIAGRRAGRQKTARISSFAGGTGHEA